jgi:hypothetical protein
LLLPIIAACRCCPLLLPAVTMHCHCRSSLVAVAAHHCCLL